MTEFEKMGGTYRQVGDYFLPNLKIGEQDEVLIGVWGQRHRRASPCTLLQFAHCWGAEQLSYRDRTASANTIQ